MNNRKKIKKPNILEMQPSKENKTKKNLEKKSEKIESRIKKKLNLNKKNKTKKNNKTLMK